MASSTTLPIVGTFLCGDPRPVGLFKYTVDKPRVTLNPKGYTTINTGGAISVVHIGKSSLYLNAIHAVFQMTFTKLSVGKARMTLAGKTGLLTHIPTKAVISVKPKLLLNGKVYAARDSEVPVIAFKPRLTLTGKPVAVHKSAIMVIGKARMTLNPKVYIARQPIKAVISTKPKLILNAKVFTRVTSYTLPVGKPQLILNPKLILRVGTPALIPTIPVARTLTPTVPQTRVLVPTAPYTRTLVPTTEKNK